MLALLMLALSTLAISVPTTSVRAVKRTDTFDNTPTVPGAGATEVVANTAGGFIYYNSFSYRNESGVDALTLQAPSPPNVIATGLVQQTNTGQSAFLPINDTVLSFDENSIYYACIYNTVGTAGKTTTCTLQLTGVVSGTGITVVQELPYNPTLLLSKFNFTTFASTFRSLTRVNIAVISAPVPLDLVLPLFDSHTYTANLRT